MQGGMMKDLGVLSYPRCPPSFYLERPKGFPCSRRSLSLFLAACCSSRSYLLRGLAHPIPVLLSLSLFSRGYRLNR